LGVTATSVAEGSCLYLLAGDGGGEVERKVFLRAKELQKSKAMHVRAEIIARGEVQRVGYRDVVERAARNLKLTGFVENVKPYDVRIVCEGERSAIDSFVEQIKITMHPIEVEDLAVRFEPATGEYAYFEIKRGDMAEELGERLDMANARMTEMKQQQDVMIGKQDVMIGKQDVMIEKQDVMIEKQDVMIEKQDVMIEKQDVMIEKLDDHTTILKENTGILKGFRSESNGNFKLLHQDNIELKELMAKHELATEERIAALATEIGAVKERLDRLEAVSSS
jgi:acylphosphatase